MSTIQVLFQCHSLHPGLLQQDLPHKIDQAHRYNLLMHLMMALSSPTTLQLHLLPLQGSSAATRLLCLTDRSGGHHHLEIGLLKEITLAYARPAHLAVLAVPGGTLGCTRSNSRLSFCARARQPL